MDWELLEREPGRTLADALIEDTRDREAWTVLADYLASQGSRLGERIMLELARDAAAPEERKEWASRVRVYDRQHRQSWLDPGLQRVLNRRGKSARGVTIDWRFGLIFGLTLDGGMHHDKPGLDEALAAILGSPVSRYLGRVSIAFGTRPAVEREGVRACIRDAAERPALTDLMFCDRGEIVNVDELLGWAPRLDRLRVEGRLRATSIEHAHLASLSLRSYPEPFELGAKRPLVLPRLRSLDVLCRTADAALRGELLALLDGAEIPALELFNVMALDADGQWGPVDLEQLGLLQRLPGPMARSLASGAERMASVPGRSGRW